MKSIALVLVFGVVVSAVSCRRRPYTAPPPVTEASITWTKEALPTTGASLVAIAGTSATDVWAVGQGIFHFDGSTWTDATPAALRGFGSGLRAIWVVSKNDVWAVGGQAHVAHYDGTTWSVEQPDDICPKPRYGQAKDCRELLGVAAWPPELWVEDDQNDYRFDGKSWSKVAHGHPFVGRVWGPTSHDVWLPNTSVEHWDGARWDATAGGKAFDHMSMRDVHGAAANDIWMVGRESRGSRISYGGATHFDGAKWSVTPMPSSPSIGELHAVYAARHDEVYAVGQNGAAIVWNGTDWSASPTGVYDDLTGVYSPGGGVAFAVGGKLGAFVLHKK